VLRAVTLLSLVVLVTVGIRPVLAHAQHARSVGPTPPRLAFTSGEVSYWRPGAGDWAPAKANTALAAGDSLYAGPHANLEVEIGRHAFIRAGSETKLDIASLETGYLQLEVTSGRVALDFKRLRDGQRVEVDTPNGAVTIDRHGYYRIDVTDRTVLTTRRGGPATVIPAGAEGPTEVAAHRQVVLEGTEVANVSVETAAAGDAWDRWNHDRAAQFATRTVHARYVSSDVAGVDDLDAAGDWRDSPRYGHVWVPRDVAPDWAPYTTGQWVWDGYYGWTWVDDAPWGWAPYHYGRWVSFGGVWGWAPGPFVATAVYAPALVTFFGPVGVSVNVGIGFPFVGWAALGFGEPIFPWWGPVGFIGTPFWCGWGGPRIVNNVVINNTTIVNARNVTTFQNVGVHNAVVAVNRGQFGRGMVQATHLTTAQAHQLQPIRGQLGVRPVAASLTAATGHASRPPNWVQGRSVVATRAAQDPARQLRTAGLASTRSAKVAASRIVPSTGGSRLQLGRNTAPPVPGVRHDARDAAATGAPGHAQAGGVARGPRPGAASSHGLAHAGPTSAHGLARGPSRAPIPPRGFARGPSRASVPPRGVARSAPSRSHAASAAPFAHGGTGRAMSSQPRGARSQARMPGGAPHTAWHGGARGTGSRGTSRHG